MPILRFRNAKMYRILTENKNPETIKKLLGNLRLDFTMYLGDGSWKGQSEPTLMIELDGASEEVAEIVALRIKQANVQEAVLLQEIPVKSRLI